MASRHVVFTGIVSLICGGCFFVPVTPSALAGVTQLDRPDDADRAPGGGGAVVDELPGDYNEDSYVNAADYTVYRNHLGEAYSLPNEGGGISPDLVTLEDYVFWKIHYGDSAVGSGAAVSLPGDYNGDGYVNAADYTVYRNHLGEVYQLPNEADGVSPGMVMVDDYNVWKAWYGSEIGVGSGGAVGQSTAVPEPASVLLFVVTGLTLVSLRFHTRSGRWVTSRPADAGTAV